MLTSSQLNFVLVFFVYGLAFFSMGIAMTLETARTPLLAERRALRPLALFGLLHGIHEWLEIIVLQGVWLGTPFPGELNWLRVGLLVLSFVPLVLFGLLLLDSGEDRSIRYLYVSAGLLIIYFVLLALRANVGPQDIIGTADALARYLLAIPGGVLAALALRERAKQLMADGRSLLAKYFRWAAASFGLYGITQVFVTSTDMLPSSFLNADLFFNYTGIPIQVVRALMAVSVTFSLIRAIAVVEREREGQLLAAQQARVEALEQVQRELVKREAMRHQLLRHTVIAQEAERSRIAHELHDETSQALTAFTLNLATLKKSLPGYPDLSGLIDRMKDLSQQMSLGIYRIMRDLRPAQLDDLGLVPALRYLVDEGRERLGLEISLRTQGRRRRLDPLVETVIFRVAQEALANVSRHAATGQASIHLSFDPNTITLRVSDSGAGFDIDETLYPPRGWGLEGMRERAESLGGQFKLESSLGKGTRVEVTIPLFPREPEISGQGHKEMMNEDHTAHVSR